MPLTPDLAALVGDAGAIVLCLACAVTDLRSYRVPNALSFGGAMLGLALAAATGSRSAVSASLAGLLLGSCALLPAAALGALGMGDVKLLGAVGALVRFPLALSALVYTLLWGGLLAFGLALARGVLADALRNLRTLRAARRQPGTLHRMPYALAILVGTVHAVASRYLPELSLW